jgi:SulP family sulfate permease
VPAAVPKSASATTVFANLRGEIAGGLAGSVVSLALALSMGILAFAPLGSEHAAVGVSAGFAAAIYGQLVVAFAGGTMHAGSVPRASTSLLLAAFVAVVAQDPAFAPSDTHGADRVVALAGLCVVLSGIVQLALGWLRLSQFARYVPYPFIAGFMCGIAVLVLESQLPAMTGIKTAALFTLDGWSAFEVATLAVGLVTGIAFFVAQARVRRIPAVLVGALAGCAAYAALHFAFPHLSLGPLVGPVAPGLPPPTALGGLLNIAGSDIVRIFPALASSAALIAIFGTLDTLFAASVVDLATDGRHDARREVLAHGLGNIVAGLCGGVPIVYSVARGMASWNAGGRTRWSCAIACVVLALMLLLGARAIASTPIVVLAGIVLVTSVSLVDRWVRGLVARLPVDAESRDRTRPLSLATVAVVAIVTITLGFLPALAVGFALSFVLLMVGMNRSLIRSVTTGVQRPSRRHWVGADAAHVQAARERTKVVELEGPLFFGTAERLADEVERSVGFADVVVLDFRLVTSIDATAALLTQRLARRMSARGVELVLAGVTTTGRHGQALLAHWSVADDERRRWFSDADKALEWAERRAVRAAVRHESAELPLEDMPLFETLDREQRAIVSRLFARMDVRRGTVVFREGDPGDSLYLIARGAVDISVLNADARRSRIVTISPGAMFGEMALFDGRTRSATAVAAERTVLYAASRQALLDDLPAEHPRIAIALLTALARQCSLRLRDTTTLLRSMDDARG